MIDDAKRNPFPIGLDYYYLQSVATNHGHTAVTALTDHYRSLC
jgi:hypothetical protein